MTQALRKLIHICYQNINDDNQRQVVILLLDMYTTSGCDCGTADVIFKENVNMTNNALNVS